MPVVKVSHYQAAEAALPAPVAGATPREVEVAERAHKRARQVKRGDGDSGPAKKKKRVSLLMDSESAAPLPAQQAPVRAKKQGRPRSNHATAQAGVDAASAGRSLSHKPVPRADNAASQFRHARLALTSEFAA